ncbi:MAG: tryptophan synthase subunit alpha [Deltaproteobacteria bacterium]
MSRIEKKFAELKDKGGKALISYIMAGDPGLEDTERLIIELEKAGADLIELGIPFSDPLADGPTIQKAAARALEQGVSLRDVIDLVKRVRKVSKVPIIFMSYYNPVFKYGEEKFVTDAVKAGVDGIIVPDLPPEEAGSLTALARGKGLDTIFLLAPTSDEDRINIVCKNSTGFIYYVSLTGVTGTREGLSKDIKGMVKKIKAHTKNPVAVGFGISRPEQAREISSWADGVIVGSAIVKIIEENVGKKTMPKKVHDFVKSLKDGMT